MNRREFCAALAGLAGAPLLGGARGRAPGPGVRPRQFAVCWDLLRPRSTWEAMTLLGLFQPGVSAPPLLEEYLARASSSRWGGDPVADLRQRLFPETLGVPVFSDQIVRAAQVLTGWTVDEARGWVSGAAPFRSSDLEDALLADTCLPRGAAVYAAYVVTHFRRIARLSVAKVRAFIRGVERPRSGMQQVLPGWFPMCYGDLDRPPAEALVEVARRYGGVRRTDWPGLACVGEGLIPAGSLRELLGGVHEASERRPLPPAEASDPARVLRPTFAGETILIVLPSTLDPDEFSMDLARRHGMGVARLDLELTGGDGGDPARTANEIAGRTTDLAHFQGVSQVLLWPRRTSTELLLSLVRARVDRVVEVARGDPDGAARFSCDA